MKDVCVCVYLSNTHKASCKSSLCNSSRSPECYHVSRLTSYWKVNTLLYEMRCIQYSLLYAMCVDTDGCLGERFKQGAHTQTSFMVKGVLYMHTHIHMHAHMLTHTHMHHQCLFIHAYTLPTLYVSMKVCVFCERVFQNMRVQVFS